MDHNKSMDSSWRLFRSVRNIILVFLSPLQHIFSVISSTHKYNNNLRSQLTLSSKLDLSRPLSIRTNRNCDTLNWIFCSTSIDHRSTMPFCISRMRTIDWCAFSIISFPFNKWKNLRRIETKKNEFCVVRPACVCVVILVNGTKIMFPIVYKIVDRYAAAANSRFWGPEVKYSRLAYRCSMDAMFSVSFSNRYWSIRSHVKWSVVGR